MKNCLHIITGHYGSGKTEFSANLALLAARRGETVTLADLDIVNPYFCVRERAELLEQAGVNVILSKAGMTDLPALNARLHALMMPNVRGILDIGGDPAGAHVLGRYSERIRAVPHEMLVVLNFRRPETGSAEQALAHVRQIEGSAQLSATGLVNNTHLCGETTREDILFGAEQAQRVSHMSGLPLWYHTCEERLVEGLALPKDQVFPLKIYFNKPWE
jgi:hypothetical protein